MKTDTTTCGVVNGVGKQMIEVDQHGRHHDQIIEVPFTTKKYPYNCSRDDEVECNMQDMDYLLKQIPTRLQEIQHMRPCLFHQHIGYLFTPGCVFFASGTRAVIFAYLLIVLGD